MAQVTRKRITAEDFETIKRLIDLGLKDADIIHITKRSAPTIYRVRRHETYEDYREWTKERTTLTNLKQAEETVLSTPEEAEPDTTNPTLERIAVALERLADAWEAQPVAKKGFFN